MVRREGLAVALDDVRALLDANVLVSAAIRASGTPGRILAALLDRDTFARVLSPAIIPEVEVTLTLPRVRMYLREPDEALLWLADLAGDTGQGERRVPGHGPSG